MVVDQLELGGGYHLLSLRSPAIAEAAQPGQFLLLGSRPSTEPLGDPLLPRPFSFLARRPEEGVVEIFYRVVGRGTSLMSAWRQGTSVRVLGPLGNPWPEPGSRRVALVAGGVGMPPILDLACTLAGGGRSLELTLFYGGRGAEHLHLVDRFEEIGVEVQLATDDGSVGFAGTNVAALEAWLEAGSSDEVEIHACGPEPMLAAATRVGERLGLPVRVSLEAPMACGIGVCRGCAVGHRDGGYRMVCVDGPVFEGAEVLG